MRGQPSGQPRRGTLSFVTQKFFCFGAINNRRNDWLGIPFCCHIGWVFTRTGRRSQSLPVPYIRRGMVPRSCYKQCRLLVSSSTNDLDSHKGHFGILSATDDAGTSNAGTSDAAIDSLSAGADRNGVGVVEVAAVLGRTSAVGAVDAD